MIKLLMLAACAVAAAEGVEHAAVGDTVEATKDDASTLTRMGRALYLDKADDHTKTGALIATAEDKAKVKRHVAAINEELAAREITAKAQSPAGMVELMAATVAAAVANAMATAAATQAAAIQAAAGNPSKAAA